ncbi:MAG: Rieske 2Fe-2S domain-containing protein [Pseudomonadales bacterium]|nr:Rieske 2Fe-2S domain-containing protein [Pseudomonadales bacterium]
MAWSDEGKVFPPYAYTDSTVFAKDSELLLSEWFAVGRTTDYSPGAYQTVELVGQPIIVWCGDDGEIRAFENVCRHRMSILAQDSGECQYLTCPFHGWTYESSGQLRSAPKVDKNLLQGIQLPEFQVEIWLGFVFVNCDRNAESLASKLKGVEKLVNPHEIDSFTFSFMQTSERVVNANWKLMMEIGLESYHFPFVHRETLAPRLTGTSDSPAGNGAWTVSTEPRKQPLAPRDDDPSALTDHERNTTYTFGLLPNTVFNIDVDNIVWFSVLPIAPELSSVIYGVAARNEHCVRPLGGTEIVGVDEYQAWGDRLGAEDNAMCERVQKGLRGKHAEPGMLIRDAENCLYEMQRYLESHIPNYPESTRS